MTTHHPVDPSERVPAPAIPFEPAQLRPRHDGWTAEKQIRFIEILSATKCVDEACRRVGMSDTSAYELRSRPCGHDFARAWDLALEFKLDRVEQAVLDRAIHGVPRPIFYKGEQVGEYRHFDERLSMFLLRSRRPWRYGRQAEDAAPPGPADDEKRRWQLLYLLCDIAKNAPRDLGNEVDDWKGRGCVDQPDQPDQPE